jgi:hypothetical protein
MKKTLLIILIALGIGYLGWGQGSESFTNLPTNSSNSYQTRSWTGDDGVIWTAEGARTDQTINGKAICWGNSGTRNLITPSYANGMGNLSFLYVRAFTGTGARSLEVYVNSELKASITVSPTSNDIITFSQDINITGSIVLEIRSTGAAQVKVDDVAWTAYTAGGNLPPVISNITQTPSSGITSVTTVSVSADVTDTDGTIAGVELHWGTTSGSLTNNIDMTYGGSGDTYTTDTDIPAQINGTTVYYEVYALDDDADETTSPEQSYTVTDPATTPLPYTQTFDADLDDCLAFSVAGATKNWIWDNLGGLTDGHAYMNGYAGSNPEEDWLILPGINFNSYSNEIMQFYTFYEYGNDDENNYLKLYYSTDYSGVGDPTGATWAALSFIKASSWGAWQPSYIVDLSAISGINVYIGFKYYSTDAPRSWRVDDISIFEGSSVDVTFQVNMAEETVSANGVHIAGSFSDWWNPAGIEMLDGDNDEIYTATLSLYSGIEYQFKYINGNAWGSDEAVPAECRADGTSNRFEIIENSSYSLDPVCFASCVNCGVLSFFDITFRVDMKNETVTGGVNIAGSFNGWNNTPMTNTSGNIWEVTLSLQETSYQEYKFKNGNNGWENFDGPCLANSWGNRYINVPSANTTIDLVCFNSCEACPAANFVMINEVDSDTPSTDVLEFVELYDGGAGNTDLTGLIVVFYNGSNDLSYAAYDLDGYSTDANGYFILGNTAVPGVDLIFGNNTLQNGQDAVALYIGDASAFPNNTAVTTVNLLDALVYDTDDADDPGLLVLLNPGQPQINENGRGNGTNHSSQRIPNGSGGQLNTYTYDQSIPTPGAENFAIYTDWTGLADNNWDNPGNWNHGVPTVVLNAVIPDVSGMKAPFPVINGPATCLGLYMATGSSLQIGTSGALTVNGTFTNNGSLTIKSDATGTGSLIENNGVTASVERYLSQDKWHYVSSPVDDPTANVFYGIYMMEWDEPSGQWSYITDPNYVLSTDMEGFAVWSSGSLTGNTTVTFNGALNTGAKIINVTNTTTALHDNKGFNFAGNPYPSALDWNVNDGSGWTRTSTNVSLSLYIWNQSAGNYGVYVKDDISGTNGVSNVIAPHQGYFVYCTADGSLSVDNGARIHSNNSILKNGDDTNPYVKFRITGNNYSDELMVNINSNSSFSYDLQFDALKLNGSSDAPQLYTKSIDGKELSVNAIPGLQNNVVIPMGVEVGETGTYVLYLDEITGLDNTPVYLQDLKTNIVINIKSSNTYKFYAETGDDPDRFLLHFTNMETSPFASATTASDVSIYTGKDKIIFTSNEQFTGSITVYDMLGQQLMTEKVYEEVHFEMTTGQMKGYYIVSLISENRVFNQKVFIK